MLQQSQASSIIQRAREIFSTEPNVVNICMPTDLTIPNIVTVIGDIHGQFHDLCQIMGSAGEPSPEHSFVFAGDYVDRGSWGVETLLLLLSWKVTFPRNVILLRGLSLGAGFFLLITLGNHETTSCTQDYGFAAEVTDKYSAVLLLDFYEVLLC